MNAFECRKMRKRSANFTKNEVTALMMLIRKYKTQIESKLLDANSNKMKDEAWERISLEFRSLPGISENPRNASILRNKYNNIKKLRRKLSQEEESRFDEDFEVTESELIKEEINSEDFEDLRGSERSSPLIFSPTPERLNQMEEPRIGFFTDLQKKFLLEEHNLKLQHMQDKHERALRFQEEEAEQRLRQMREEHKLQMEILQLRKQCLLK